MEEKQIIKSTKGNLESIVKKMYIGAGVLICYVILFYWFNIGECREYIGYNYLTREYDKINTIDFFNYLCNCHGGSGVVFAIGILLIIFTSLVYWWLKNTDITVTDKRVYGTTATGKRVDLPFDKISAVATSLFKGIAVATSSGKINFKMIANRDDIHKELSKLLIDRQSNKQNQKNTNNSTTEELKQYKELLDNGVITQEEFEQKKKQLLNL